MSRRIVAVVIALVAALTLSSCSSTKNADLVVQVGDAKLSQEDVAALMNDPLLVAQMQTPDVTDGTADLNAVDQVASVWVWLEAASQQGAQLDDEAVAAAWYAKLDTSQSTTDMKTKYDATTGVVRTMMTRLGVANTKLSDTTQSATFSVEVLQDAARQSDVVVHSRYGYWDDETARVVPMGMVVQGPTTTSGNS